MPRCFPWQRSLSNAMTRRLLPIVASALLFVFLCLVWNCQAWQQGEAEGRGLKNGGFEELDSAGLPTGWAFPPRLKEAGYQLTIDKTNAFAGDNSVLVDSTAVKEIGNAVRQLDAVHRRQAVSRQASSLPRGRANGGSE